MSRTIRFLTSSLALAASSPVLAQSADNAEIARQIAALTKSLETAKAQVAEAEKGIEALKAKVLPDTVPEPNKTIQVVDTQQIQNACPQGGIDQLAYIKAVRDCEKAIFDQSDVKSFKAKSVTGVGASIAAATSGSTATFSLRHSTIFRSLSTRAFGTIPEVEQQRAWRQNFELGVRSDINKDDKNVATLATFGQLDRLASNVAVFAEFGRDYSASEPLHRTTKGSTWSFVNERAKKVMDDLSVKCRGAGGKDCESTGLVRWIFAPKDDGFANPDAVKSYNEVFWGPPEVDRAPRFGWSVRGELSRPTFDYYPFALTQVPDPFNPGKSKTVIDQNQFPQDFGSRVIENEAHLNWALTGKLFFHVSTIRAKNYTSNYGPSRLVPYVDWETGTTFFVTASYVRKSEIQKPFRDTSVCPTTPLSGTFTTSQLCTTLNIAGPTTNNGFVLGGEVRQGFAPFWYMPPTLLSARYTHDFSTKENGLIVPLYFAEDDKGIFKSGLQFGHKWGGVNGDGSRKPAESVFGVVVGVAIGLDGTKN